MDLDRQMDIFFRILTIIFYFLYLFFLKKENSKKRTHRRFLHLPLEGSLGHNYTEHQLQCMLHQLTASSEIHSPEFDKPCQFITKKMQLKN